MKVFFKNMGKQAQDNPMGTITSACVVAMVVRFLMITVPSQK